MMVSMKVRPNVLVTLRWEEQGVRQADRFEPEESPTEVAPNPCTRAK